MLLKSKTYRDSVSKLSYNLTKTINFEDSRYFLIDGENGIGKSRFVEGILLKEIKNENKKLLYFGQDIENQILSFELISLVKTFIYNLRKERSFFKTIFLNDDSHNKTNLEFSEKSTLTPDNNDIKNFIIKESDSYGTLDIVIFDEVDKYFNSEDEFIDFLKNIDVKTIFIISHILNYGFLENNRRISLKENKGVIDIELFNT